MKRVIVVRPCGICKEPFEADLQGRGRWKYCSDECAKKAMAMTTREWIGKNYGRWYKSVMKRHAERYENHPELKHEDYLTTKRNAPKRHRALLSMAGYRHRAKHTKNPLLRAKYTDMMNALSVDLCSLPSKKARKYGLCYRCSKHHDNPGTLCRPCLRMVGLITWGAYK